MKISLPGACDALAPQNLWAGRVLVLALHMGTDDCCSFQELCDITHWVSWRRNLWGIVSGITHWAMCSTVTGSKELMFITGLDKLLLFSNLCLFSAFFIEYIEDVGFAFFFVSQELKSVLFLFISPSLRMTTGVRPQQRSQAPLSTVFPRRTLRGSVRIWRTALGWTANVTWA